MNLDAIHVSGATAPPGITGDEPLSLCCIGEAVYGPQRCTCWEPVYDLEQRVLENGGKPPEEITIRSKCCHDCAYRNGSPEREDGEDDWLDDIALDGRSEFYCHQGMRRIVAWEHPDGRRIEASDGCYAPPKGPSERPMPWKADGAPGELCAGWSSVRKGAR